MRREREGDMGWLAVTCWCIRYNGEEESPTTHSRIIHSQTSENHQDDR